ncbi:MAG: T9SS type A sorting domain-containing protein, partial [Bacteroidia bacterium]
PSINSRYMIEIIPPGSCTSTRGAINTSRSNIKVTSVTGIQNANANILLAVYPNPAADQITLHAELQKKEKMLLRLLDPLGRIVFERSIEAAVVNERIPLGGLANGVYLFEVRTPTAIKQVKIIKEE